MATLIETDHQNGVLTNEPLADDVNGNVSPKLAPSETSANGIPVPGRIRNQIRRSKSLGSATTNGIDEIESPSSPSEPNLKKFMKNARRSRSRFGRGLTKKGNELWLLLFA